MPDQTTPLLPKGKLICTADNPAPGGYYRYAYVRQWDCSYEHPDATGVCINDDFDDWRYTCPHCKCTMIYEGPDA